MCQQQQQIKTAWRNRRLRSHPTHSDTRHDYQQQGIRNWKPGLSSSAIQSMPSSKSICFAVQDWLWMSNDRWQHDTGRNRRHNNSIKNTRTDNHSHKPLEIALLLITSMWKKATFENYVVVGLGSDVNSPVVSEIWATWFCATTRLMDGPFHHLPTRNFRVEVARIACRAKWVCRGRPWGHAIHPASTKTIVRPPPFKPTTFLRIKQVTFSCFLPKRTKE